MVTTISWWVLDGYCYLLVGALFGPVCPFWPSQRSIAVVHVPLE